MKEGREGERRPVDMKFPNATGELPEAKRALQSELSFSASPPGDGKRDSDGPPFESDLNGRMLREA